MHLVYIPHGALLLGLPSAGQIPPALGSLTALQELSLPYNLLIGESHQSWRPSEDAHTIHPEHVAGRARQTTSLRSRRMLVEEAKRKALATTPRLPFFVRCRYSRQHSIFVKLSVF